MIFEHRISPTYFQNTYLFLIAMLLNLMPLRAQTCLEFEDLPVGTSWTNMTEGDLMLTEAGISAFASFINILGTPVLNNAELIYMPNSNFNSWPQVLADGNALYLNESGAEFDFSTVNNANFIEFDCYVGETAFYISINGGTPILNNNLDELFGEIYPGIFFEAVRVPNTARFHVTIEGEVETLLLGGWFFFLDNICFTSLPACSISNVTANPEPCNVDGEFYVNLGFDFTDVGAEGFEVVGNGNNYGTFNYGEFSYLVGPLSGDNSTEWEFVVIDIADNNCQVWTSIQPINCMEECNLFDLEIWDFSCNTNGTFNANLNVQFENITNDFFDIFIDDEFHSSNSFANLPINFESTTNENVNLTICENDNTDCCTSLMLANPCATTCVLSDLYLLDSYCVDGNLVLLLDFEYLNEGEEGYEVIINGVEYGPFPYGVQPAIASLPGDGITDFNILVRDIANPDCQAPLFLEAISCACSISEVFAEAFDCSEGIGVFLVDVEFNIENGGNEGFSIIANGDTFGPFQYGEGFYTFGPVPGNGEEIVITIVDNADNQCSDFYILDGQICDSGDVWPGDANYDNISNNFDILNIGIAYNSSGEPRVNNDVNWNNMMAAEWADYFESGSNYKHADCNGNGVVNQDDIIATDLNYNLVHGDIDPYETPMGAPEDPELYVDMNMLSEVIIGVPFTVPIIMGSNAIPVDQIYGVAFTLEFDPTMFDDNSVEVNIDDSFLGDAGLDMISYNRNFADQGLIDVAITRIDQTDVEGFGTIANFTGIIDDIAGKTEVQINIKDVKGITKSEEVVRFNYPNYVFDLTNVEDFYKSSISIFPNPTNDYLSIQSDLTYPIESIQVINLLGQNMPIEIIGNNYNAVRTTSLLSGVYFLAIEMEGTKIYKKFEIQR